MIFYTENSKDSTIKPIELSNEYSKVAGYKINTQKSLAFLYTNNEKTEREIKETIPFTIAKKRIKYLGITLPKETKYLYIENYKTLMKEIKNDTKQIEKYAIFMDWKNQYGENEHTTQSYLQIQCNPCQAPMVFFIELEQIISQFVWKYKKISTSQSNLEKEEWNQSNQPA